MTEVPHAESNIAAMQRGDPRAAERVFRTHQPMLLRYLRSQEPRAAEDIAGEVWLAAAKSLDEFVGDESGFRSWLFTVARRRVIEHRRRGVRRRTDPMPPSVFGELLEADDSSERATDSTEAQRAVQLMVEHLSPEQSEVLILRVVADLSAAQVADLMQRPETWVRTTQHRALKRLAAHLDARMELSR